MNRQGPLAVWIIIGAALVVGVWSIRDSGEPVVEAGAETTLEPSPDTDTDTDADADASTTTSLVTTTTEAPTTTQPTTTTLPPDQLPDPTTPAELATALSEAESMVRTTEDSAPWGRRQQRLYRVLSANRSWAPEVLAGVDESIRPAVTSNWEARQNLSALVSSGSLSTVLPAWRIREPLPAEDLLALYREAEEQTGVPWEYLAAINLVETRMGRIEGQSVAGATGPMQFLPSTFAECCDGDPTVDRDAIIGAAVYLTTRGGPADMSRALRGYNNSARYVDAVTAYATVLEADPSAYAGYHAWEVYFLSESEINNGAKDLEGASAFQAVFEAALDTCR